MTELSHEIKFEGLTSEPRKFEFEASGGECKALAKRFGILALHHVKVKGVVGRVAGRRDIELSGRIRAALEQNCSITLKPVEEQVDTSFDIRFSDRISEDSPISNVDEWLEDQSFEPMPTGPVDVGEIATQYLSMAINSFPRISGATLDTSALEGIEILSEETDREARSPFSRLKKFKDRG